MIHARAAARFVRQAPRVEYWLMPGAPACLARRRGPVLIGIATVFAIAAACARGPAPPDPASIGDLDPEVKTLIEEQTAAVNQQRSDATRWGRLAMAYEANGRLVEAENAYAVAIELGDSEPLWRYHRALLVARRGDLQPALADL